VTLSDLGRLGPQEMNMRIKLPKGATLADLGVDMEECRDMQMAPSNWIKAHQQSMARLLQAIDHPEAWVTDESCIGDFCLSDHALQKASARLGFQIKGADYIRDIAQCLESFSRRLS